MSSCQALRYVTLPLYYCSISTGCSPFWSVTSKFERDIVRQRVRDRYCVTRCSKIRGNFDHHHQTRVSFLVRCSRFRNKLLFGFYLALFSSGHHQNCSISRTRSAARRSRPPQSCRARATRARAFDVAYNTQEGRRPRQLRASATRRRLGRRVWCRGTDGRRTGGFLVRFSVSYASPPVAP
jgi:hypothetical protein